MMRQMRENTKWIMLITALAFVALMVFEWGMDMTGRSGAVAGGDIGRVNGESSVTRNGRRSIATSTSSSRVRSTVLSLAR
jgi:hypothetical protein